MSRRFNRFTLLQRAPAAVCSLWATSQVRLSAAATWNPPPKPAVGDASSFQVYVLESGHGLPSVCNDQSAFGGGDFDPNNPFTPDIKVYNQNGRLIRNN